MDSKNVVLLVGGVRSGKSRLAQARAESSPGELVFVATAQPFDAEMTERIALHQADRGPRWRTVEEPLDVAGTLALERREDRVVVVDCLTLWLSNLMLGEHDIAAATTQLVDALAEHVGTVIIVSNEVGMGIVPENALARRFRDEAGRLNQQVAAAANEVLLVAAGLAIRMK
ncbi:MAG: bifunctional adenosylcobinamide kinase/adenosylcobinamide-phosphate guanylyltransferase [Gammaproteobacteria bacterium]